MFDNLDKLFEGFHVYISLLKLLHKNQNLLDNCSDERLHICAVAFAHNNTDLKTSARWSSKARIVLGFFLELVRYDSMFYRLMKQLLFIWVE